MDRGRRDVSDLPFIRNLLAGELWAWFVFGAYLGVILAAMVWEVMG